MCLCVPHRRIGTGEGWVSLEDISTPTQRAVTGLLWKQLQSTAMRPVDQSRSSDRMGWRREEGTESQRQKQLQLDYPSLHILSKISDHVDKVLTL